MEEWNDQHRKIMDAVARTEIIKSPQQHLHTFGVTNLLYYVVTEPSYLEVVPGPAESVIREGNITAERPAVVTPTYMAHLEGFREEARKYLDSLAREYGPNTPGLLYHYRNEPRDMSIVEGDGKAVAHRISDRLSREGNRLAAVILGVNELWDVSLLKFIFEYTLASLAGNIQELHGGGLLRPEPRLGVPRAAIQRIEALFREVEQGADPSLLKRELDRWELFDHYQDRFLALFRRKGR